MKLNELLTESEVARFYPYGAANTELDMRFNPEACKMNMRQHERYKTLKTAFGGAPVIKHDCSDKSVDPMQTQPKSHEIQSPGYRGKQRALQHAGVADNSYQRFDPNELKHQLDDLLSTSRLF